MKLVHFPQEIGLSTYQSAIDNMAEKLISNPQVRSVFQVGGIADPGISDIDLFVIFEDGCCYTENPLNGHSATEKYLFIHSLFGCTDTHFKECKEHEFFHNYSHLRGEEHSGLGSYEESSEVTRLRNAQAALEYLLKFYITMTVERTYKIAKVRNLLLNVKALRYDLSSLGVTSGALFDMIAQVVEWRKTWFDRAPDDREITGWFHSFHNELAKFLPQAVKESGFCLPSTANLQISRNTLLVRDSAFSYSHRGLALPSFLGGLGRRYFNIQHRFNRFSFHLEIGQECSPAIRSRYDLISRLVAYNHERLPHFLPVPYGLAVF